MHPDTQNINANQHKTDSCFNGPIRPKLITNQFNGAYEQEAGAMREHVMNKRKDGNEDVVYRLAEINLSTSESCYFNIY